MRLDFIKILLCKKVSPYHCYVSDHYQCLIYHFHLGISIKKKYHQTDYFKAFDYVDHVQT